MREYTGNPCPDCGCRDVRDIDGRHQCRHCGRLFTNRLTTATYQRTVCPHCNSQNTIVTATLRPIRYHCCRDCLKTFKSKSE